jgi:hypothetical protein
MAGNNYNLKGGYVQQGKIYTGQIKGDIAFVYSRLKTNDVIFGGGTGYTTETTSWRRLEIFKQSPDTFPDGSNEAYCCVEMPDNCGDYTTKERCLAGSTDKEVAPGIENSLNAQSMQIFLMYLLGSPNSGPYVETDLAVSYTRTGDRVAVWTRGFIGLELAPFINPAASMAVSDALIVPPGVGVPGVIGWYGGLPTWKGATWAYHRDYVAYHSGNGGNEMLLYERYIPGVGTGSGYELTALYNDGSSGYPSPGYQQGYQPRDYSVDGSYGVLTMGRDTYETMGDDTWCSTGNLKTVTGLANARILKQPFSDDPDPSHTFKGRKYNGHGVPVDLPVGYEASTDQFVRDERITGSLTTQTSCNSLCVVWRGDVLVAGSVNNLMNNIKTYWGFETSLFCGGYSPIQGCFNASEIGGDVGNLERPEPPKITWGQFKGRKSEVVLNFQDMKGNAKELVLPIEFSSRATHLKFDDNDFYPAGFSGEWIPREAPYAGEWFDSRISMTKDDIFVDILYEMVQEWEPVSGAIRLKASGEFRDTVGTGIYYAASYYNICGNYDWLQFLQGSGSNPFENTSRPKRTRFNKIKSFKINKKSFAITATANYTYPTPPTLSQETLHNKLIKHYTIADPKTSEQYWGEYESIFKDGLSSETYVEQPGLEKIPELLESYEYLGLPLVYPQQFDIPGQYARANDFIKPQSAWTELDWLFWELLERPQKGGASYVNFLKNGKYGYQGRTQSVTTSFIPGTGPVKSTSPNAYYVPYGATAIKRSPIIPDYWLRVLESERLRGSAKIEDGIIKKWWRIHPTSFPVIMTGGYRANSI